MNKLRDFFASLIALSNWQDEANRVVELMKYVVMTDSMDQLGGREVEYVLFDPDGDVRIRHYE